MKIEVHLLQNFAPSCLNRDDTNTPKTCDFGGVTRARISSQCFKKAVRDHFEQLGIEKGTRSKRIKEAIAEVLGLEDPVAREIHAALKTNQHPESPASQLLSAALTLFVEAYYSKMDKQRVHETDVLLYWSAPELSMAAECFREEQDALVVKAPELITFMEAKAAKGKKGAAKTESEDESKRPAHAPDNKIKKRLQSAGLTPDIALFGRMLAANPDTNIDAACQVAHALSTHAVNLEMDFFTAVDDKNPEGTTGAGMLGVTGYDSACFYRYALVDFGQLQKNLGGSREKAEESVEGFLKAFVEAIPTGKQNSMAAHSLPSLALFVVRERGVPCSLVNAFARPIYSDLVDGSVFELTSYWRRINKMYAIDKDATIAISYDGREEDKAQRLASLASFEAVSVYDAIDVAMDAVRGTKVGVAK